jgi:hypothetical protein
MTSSKRMKMSLTKAAWEAQAATKKIRIRLEVA